jgi:hypothetical protein
MKKRSPAAPLLLPIVTLGIYSLVWLVKTKNEMNETATNKIPSAWLLIVPIGNWVWYWKYAVGVEEFTNHDFNRAGTFWLLALLGPIGAAFVQASFNRTLTAPRTYEAFQPAAV